MDVVEIAPGWFWMGWAEGHPGERPCHRVWTDGFAIGRFPVTNREYARFIETGRVSPPPWRADVRFDHPEQPVVGVSWAEAMAYCDWLTEETGTLHRLPSEAEWEKAARGGLEGARYPWGNSHPPAFTLDRPPRVTVTRANPWGLRALSGVCHEWCLDWEDDGYYARSPERNPLGPPTGTRRASRGGAWRHKDPWSPVAHRSSLPPGLRFSDYGFRVARPLG